MKKVQLLIVGMSSMFFLGGCASILNSKYQKVMVHTDSQDSKVYLNDEYVGQGSGVVVKMKRDLDAKQLRIERENYKPEFKTYFQTKKSPLYIMSVIPFGVLLYPLFYDYGPKAYDHGKELRASAKTKLPLRQHNQKYIYVNKAAFNLGKKDITFNTISHDRYVKNKKSRNVQNGEEDLKLDNTIFADKLNSILKKGGFADTLHRVLKSNSNSLYLQANVSKLILNSVYKSYTSGYSEYLTAEATIEWEIQDVYSQSKHKVSIESKSGEFSIDFYRKSKEHVRFAVEDVITNSFIELMSKADVQRLLNMEKNASSSGHTALALEKPSRLPASVSDAIESTVTITYKGGHGSGCIVSKNGYIITNFHVVAEAKDLEVVLNNGKKYKAVFIRANEAADLALLKIEEKFDLAYVLPTGSNFTLGQEVFAVGTPSSVELGQTLSRGIISATRKVDSGEWIQTDVSVNFGNSGGALINQKGELVGIVNGKVVGFGVEGIGFCIPAKDVSHFLSLGY